MSTRCLFICYQVWRYLTGDWTLPEFYEWLAVYTWNNHLWGDRQAEVLANQIEGTYYEYQHGDITLDELEQEWRAEINKYPQAVTRGCETFTYTFNLTGQA